jgi:hypothetical protein
MENTVFWETIIQPKGNIYIFPIVMIIFMIIMTLGIIGLMVGVISTSKNTSISIKNNEIIINSFMYGRKIPIENIFVNEIKRINLNDSEYNIRIRTNGISLPYLKCGWMRLKNQQKALVYITDKENVLLMPTKDFVVLFSMEKIDEFINKLKERL